MTSPKTETLTIEMKDYHHTRLVYDKRRNLLWKTLCETYFQRYVGPEDCVLELGAGYGDFINHIRCKRRIAVDAWDGMTEYLQPGIEAHVCSVTDLGVIEDNSVDFAFASNLFEHLTQAQFAQALHALRSKLKKGGTLNILQPNYRFAYREYFDDYTHVTVYSDRSLADFLSANGFDVKECHPRFLPLTIKSRMPVSPALIRLYLAMPFKPLGKQMLLRAVRRCASTGK
jgi:ubiquinone/menaquinone biosynthesis C-methylase UbiE